MQIDKTTDEIILPVLLFFSLNTPLTINTITVIYQDDIETNIIECEVFLDKYL